MYDKRTFAKGMGASFLVVAVVVLVVASTGTAYAMSVAGVGGFQITADRITADSQVIYPGVEDTSSSPKRPMLVVEQTDVRIQGLTITKEIPASSFPGVSGDARIVIQSNSEVTINEQLLKMTRFSAGTAKFKGQVIDEQHSNRASEKFLISAGPAADPQSGKITNIQSGSPGVVLKDVEIRGHYLATDQISLPDTDIAIQYDADDDGDYHDSKESLTAPAPA